VNINTLNEFSPECLVKDGWQHGVQFSGGFGLEALKRVIFGFEIVRVCAVNLPVP